MSYRPFAPGQKQKAASAADIAIGIAKLFGQAALCGVALVAGTAIVLIALMIFAAPLFITVRFLLWLGFL